MDEVRSPQTTRDRSDGSVRCLGEGASKEIGQVVCHVRSVDVRYSVLYVLARKNHKMRIAHRPMPFDWSR